jgi:hypothetical protein
VVVVSAGTGEPGRLVRRLLASRRDVASIVGPTASRQSLTAVLPADSPDFGAVLGVPAREYRGVAAVTTTLDGSGRRRAPVAIVLNPLVWPHLSRLGADVVLTHEATHAVTGSVTSGAPLWITEGFADFVAMRSAHVPARLAVSAALRRIRSAGLPRHLPTDPEFGLATSHLEGTYELARLAVRVIARREGVPRLLRFYADVVAAPEHRSAAWASDLGVSRADLTRQWRRLLVRLAGAR